MRQISILVLFTLFLSDWLGAQVERWTLEPGAERVLDVPVGARLHLSQKNIVEIEGENPVRLLALRTGLVSIRAKSAEGTLLRTWVVEVISALQPEKTKVLHQRIWQQFFCQERGVRCLPDEARIVGQTESWVWQNKARDQCESLRPCRFEVELSQESRTSLSQVIKKDLAIADVDIDASGFATLHWDCDRLTRGEQDRQIQWIRDRYVAKAVGICLVKAQSPLLLEWLAVAHRKTKDELDNPLQWKIRLLQDSLPLEASVEGLSRESYLKVLARPRVYALPGAEVKLSDGGEMPIFHPKHDGLETQWKQIGFALEAKLIDLKLDQLRMLIDVRLSRPQNGSLSLDSSSLRTETDVRLGSWALIGSMTAETSDDGDSRLPWFAQIPLLGRLFRWSSQAVWKSEVSLFLRARAMDYTQSQADAREGEIVPVAPEQPDHQ